MRPGIVSHVGHRLREAVRSIEHRTLPAGRGVPTRTDQIRDLLSESFYLDGVWVIWGEATVEQHQLRAAQLRAIADRSIETAARHEQVAETLTAAGASCLAELYANRQAVAA